MLAHGSGIPVDHQRPKLGGEVLPMDLSREGSATRHEAGDQSHNQSITRLSSQRAGQAFPLTSGSAGCLTLTPSEPACPVSPDG